MNPIRPTPAFLSGERIRDRRFNSIVIPCSAFHEEGNAADVIGRVGHEDRLGAQKRPCVANGEA